MKKTLSLVYICSFLFFFIFTTENLLSQTYRFGTVDSLVIIPDSPTTDDYIRVIAYTTFNSSPCEVISVDVDVSGNQISAFVTYSLGLMSAICHSSDTVDIGLLDEGIYHLTYISSIEDTTASPNYDTIEFSIVSTYFSEKKNLENSISIRPNYFNDYANLKICHPNEIIDMRVIVFDYSGKIVRENKIKSNETIIERRDFSDGVYFLQVYSDNKILHKERFVIF